MTQAGEGGIRIDKWLWAARFFKTRPLAAAAVAGGKVKVNGERVKAAKVVRPGDRLSVHIGPYEHLIQVRALSDRRGPAPQAATLYEESAASKAAREQLKLALSVQRVSFAHEKGRPTKKDRREMIRFKKGAG